uniref:Vascular endothelial growth factor A n=1 Tax=Salvator merianae TaxID=96440 RepID=A0A8D0BEY7_SALMN
MNFLLTWIHCGVAALLYLHNAKLSQAAPAQGDGEKQDPAYIPFDKVFERSYCRPLETMVDIYQEYPDEVETIFRPSCVPLMRCAGCCTDEALECVPIAVYNTTMQIMKLRLYHYENVSLMSFQEHKMCQCRPKKEVKSRPENHCEPCPERRKHLYKQDPQTCKCSCKFTDSRCKSKQLELNERTCRCEKPRR